MTGWLAVALLAVAIVAFFRAVFALDRWENLREWERREAKRMARWGRVGDTDKRPQSSSAGRPSRLG